MNQIGGKWFMPFMATVSIVLIGIGVLSPETPSKRTVEGKGVVHGLHVVYVNDGGYIYVTAEDYDLIKIGDDIDE